ncbi:MAG: nucleoside monophosphate kinase [Lentisphaeria bacterium]|nr:nucleoside monophosphate kinase [Lentisphaeria bacterium]NQZ68848.1 nucleoside monophosphate kinase [Lentisphaeria bacterium]
MSQNNEMDRKSAKQIFSNIIHNLEKTHEREDLLFPKEIIWLGGAPGSGKGTNTPFINRERDFTAPPIVMSDFLKSDTAMERINKGQLVEDSEVAELLFEELLKEEYQSGVVVDGFPRTKVQVQLVRYFFEEMQKLRKEFFNTPIGPKFRRPRFRITILFVDEEVSIQRQIRRGKDIKKHNKKVKESGKGEILEIRKTDLDPELARKRYDVFRDQTYSALLSLRDIFQFNLINANGDIADVESQINDGFQYQSGLELGEDTFDSIHHIPVVGEITKYHRQKLVQRLDNYRSRHSELFAKVLDLITREMMNDIKRHAVVGKAIVRLDNLVLNDSLAVDMVIDILTERGFLPTVDIMETHIPVSVDLTNGSIQNAVRKEWVFSIIFHSSTIRKAK